MFKKIISTFAICLSALSISSFAMSQNDHGMKRDIVDVAIKTSMFNTLVAALQAGDLVDVLKGDGPFTVFAPNDEAFAKLPAGTVEMLLKPENKDQLVAVLTYHVVPGKIRSSQVVTVDSAQTVQGQSVSISVVGDAVMIDSAKVVLADVDATNGIIHVIDSVLLPK